jgi:tRNA-splicing ligase RtcB
MACAANYAFANRQMITHFVRETFERSLEIPPREHGISVVYDVCHNIGKFEKHLVEGRERSVFVHRKGATRALPAGHPDLVRTRWEGTGHPVLIPGSMFAGAAILFPKAGAAESGFSVNHGSGRLLGRGQAKRELACLQEDIDAKMADVRRTFGGVEIEGIVLNTPETPLDECGEAYKDLDEVLRVLEVEGVAEIAHRLNPVASIKGAD